MVVGVFGVVVVKLVVVENRQEHAQILLQHKKVLIVLEIQVNLVTHKDALVINLYFYFH